MGEYLLIVTGDQPNLRDYLRRQFSGVEKVQVLLDQRQGERRQWVQPHEPERRRGDRRRQPGTSPRSDWFVIVGRAD